MKDNKNFALFTRSKRAFSAWWQHCRAARHLAPLTGVISVDDEASTPQAPPRTRDATQPHTTALPPSNNTCVDARSVPHGTVDAPELCHTPVTKQPQRRTSCTPTSSSHADSQARNSVLANISAAVSQLTRTRQASLASQEKVFLIRLLRTCEDPTLLQKARSLLLLLSSKDVDDPVLSAKKDIAITSIAGFIEEGRACTVETLGLMLEEIDFVVHASRGPD